MTEHEFLIHDRTIGGAIDYADDFRELIQKLAYHLRFYKDENTLGFSVADGPKDWNWNLDVALVIAQGIVQEMYSENGDAISPDDALMQAKETILHLTGGVPVGFRLEEVTA